MIVCELWNYDFYQYYMTGIRNYDFYQYSTVVEVTNSIRTTVTRYPK